MWRWCLLAGLLAATASSESNATGSSYRLFNAYQAPLSALTSPGNLYFLEFPILGNGVSPMCGDGTPFSFAFRRGSDQHVSKLLIELEGGPACWGQDTSSDGVCCSSDAALQTPWYHFYTQQENSSLPIDKFPQLNTCAGITPGFAQMGSQELFRRDNKEDQHPADIPVFLRNDAATFGNPDEWWNVLGGNYSHVSDWSYILIPHCTLDWHLGHQERPQSFRCDKNLSEDSNGNSSVSNNTIREVYHRGGTNLEAVVEWVQAQFPQGLDALVVGSGGKVGGCGRAADASSIASSIVASKLSNHNAPGSDSLVIAEGSALWKSDLPNDNDLANRWNAADIPEGGSLVEGLKDWLQAAPQSLQVAWLASAGGTAGKAEKSLMENLEESKGESFHVLQAPPSDHQQWCPRFAFPKESSTPTFASFLQHIVQSISWNVASSNDLSVEDDFESTDNSFHLSFLSISLMIIAVVVLIWIVYFAVNYNQNRRGRPSVPSPSDLWFMALTRYPLIFLLVSVLIPLSLSFAAYAKSGYQVPVNLDFDSYLEINTPLENVRRAYDKARGHQKESLTLEAENCELLSEGAETQPSFLDRRELLDDSPFTFHIEHNVSLENLEPDHRELYGSNMLYYSGGEAIAIMYQNRNGGNVFEPDVLRDIFEFEQAIYRFPGFASYCFGFGPGRCIPIDSLVTHFFPEGYLVSDIDSVVRSFLGNQPALWKLDQNFGPDNLQSEVIRSFIFLQDLGGDQSAAHPFLESLYREYFWKVDQTNTHTAMIHTWDNEHLKKVEANDALKHDTLWSIGSLCFIALMIHLKVRSLFVVFFSMLGLILAFTASFYWASVHFAIQSATLLWVAGLYVMLGIGADDIFLMVDSFEHTKIQTGAISQHNDKEASSESSKEAQLSLLRERMKEAYHKAGSMMLVSSVTTAICFFSNAFGILVVIQEFGIFMG
jgi:Patched family